MCRNRLDGACTILCLIVIGPIAAHVIMRNMMKHFWQWFGILMTVFFVFPCLAVDPGIYEGVWQTEGDGPAITLIIHRDPQQIEVTINQHRLIDVTVNYLYGPSAAYPFLFVHASEVTENDPNHIQYDHALYLIIGALEPGIGRASGLLRGFYEFSRVKNDHHGTVESVSYPVELAPAAL